MSIPLEVKTYIENYKPSAEKDLMYINKHNWAMDDNVFKRIKGEKKQRLLTERALNKLKYFDSISKEHRGSKSVENFTNLLVEIVDTYIERQGSTDKLHDWTNYEEEFKHLPEETLEEKISNEIGFQSDILDVVNRLRLGVKGLNLDGQGNSLAIDIFADIPPPFLLRDKMETLYPEIKEYMQKLHEKE
jgi:hypothetical protein